MNDETKAESKEVEASLRERLRQYADEIICHGAKARSLCAELVPLPGHGVPKEEQHAKDTNAIIKAHQITVDTMEKYRALQSAQQLQKASGGAEDTKRLVETLRYARYWIGWLTSRGLHDHLYPITPHEKFPKFDGFESIDAALASREHTDEEVIHGSNATSTEYST